MSSVGGTCVVDHRVNVPQRCRALNMDERNVTVPGGNHPPQPHPASAHTTRTTKHHKAGRTTPICRPLPTAVSDNQRLPGRRLRILVPHETSDASCLSRRSSSGQGVLDSAIGSSLAAIVWVRLTGWGGVPRVRSERPAGHPVDGGQEGFAQRASGRCSRSQARIPVTVSAGVPSGRRSGSAG